MVCVCIVNCWVICDYGIRIVIISLSKIWFVIKSKISFYYKFLVIFFKRYYFFFKTHGLHQFSITVICTKMSPVVICAIIDVFINMLYNCF